MKRMLVLFLVLFFVLLSCAKETKIVKIDEKPNAVAEIENETTAENEAQQQQSSQPANDDLAIDKVLLSTMYPDVGETFEVKITITNYGKQEISNFEYLIEVYKGTNVVKQDRQTYGAMLNKSASVKITREYSLAETGSYDIKIKIDPSNEIAELNEVNNEKTVTITVSGPSNVTQTTTTTSTTNKTSGLCTDSDGGKIYNVKGTCSGKNAVGFVDICVESTLLWEWYCDAYANCQYTERMCRCEEGVCVS